MSTSKTTLNKLAIKMARDSRYRFQRNGTIKKRSADGKYRAVGTTRHGYNVVTYSGTKLVSARVLVAKSFIASGLNDEQTLDFLNRKVVARVKDTLDDSVKNIYTTRQAYLKRDSARRLSQRQIDRMVELFFDGYSVAKIARRFRRRISRSNVSRIIKRELGFNTLEG